MSSLPRFRRMFLGLVLVFTGALLPLRAQLDPRLQSTGPDFLDLYQQTQNLVMKPEVVTVFDFSGSMAQVMYHKDYTGGGDETNAGMTFTLTGPGNGTLKDKYGTVMANGRYEVTVKLTSGLTLTKGSLVRPDGSLLEYKTGGDTAINTNYVYSTPLLGGENLTTGYVKASDVRNWIRCASHVRFTASATDGGKTFDLPLCWTILDRDTTVDLTNADINLRQFRKSYNTSYPLKMTIINPSTSSNTEIEMDAAYRVMPNTTASYGMYSAVTLLTTGVKPMTACTFRNGNNTDTNFVGWGGNYIKWIFQTSTIPQATTAAGQAFANNIPARTRVQAVKDAAMRTWCKYYNKVFWAYRSLKYYGAASLTTTTQYDSANRPCNDSRNNKSVAVPTTTAVFGATQRAWYLLNDDLPTNGTTLRSDEGLRRLGYMVCGGSTPLNSAMANTLAQLNDPNNVFNDIEKGVDRPVECRNTYVLLFTDGIPNTDDGTPENVNTPYITSGSGTAAAGNAVFAVKTRIDTTNATPYYNIINLAALAAHGGDATNSGFTVPTYPTTTQTYLTTAGWLTSAWSPFWMRGRGAGTEAITFTKPRPITTMTIGVSLKGTNTDTTGTKYRLFAAAACGDPSRTTWNLNTLTEFQLLDSTDPTKGKTANSTYFFDATNPAKLTTGLDAAFNEATQQSNISASANPNLPFIGAALGQQVYVGKFRPPSAGGGIWPGDLLMFGTREVNGDTQMINKLGDIATTLDETTAFWSTSDALSTTNKLWSTRKLYTRLPSLTTTESPIRLINSDLSVGDYVKYDGMPLLPYVATSLPRVSDAEKIKVLQVLQFVAGGDTSTVSSAQTTLPPVVPTGNRKTIMGDIINSAPAAVEYQWSEVVSRLTPRLTAAMSATGVNRFRLILVGTNQGWLHAFGEVTNTSTITDTSGTPQSVVTGAVDELWAFLPTDFLTNLDKVQTNKTHRFMVDGTPAIYHLDLPPSTGGSGNGVVDSTERAIAVFGLRKGGRSYYALDIHDPFTPAMKWALRPDEANYFPPTRIVTDGPTITTVQAILNTWGYSSCTPAFGRVQFKDVIRDAVFLGGGFSVPDVEANFPDASSNPTKLGRSVMALDVYTGAVLAATDLTATTIGGTTVGPVAAGLIPFEYIINSGMAQRAYFLDYKGGLWAWGSKAVSATAPYVDFRTDTSQLTNWSIRKVYQDANNAGSLGARYTTLPAPFRVGTFPGVGKTGSAAPSAVGIAMVSGDRNNPVDSSYNTTTNLAPVNHRLTVVFDRQDSRAWSLDTAAGPDTGITTEGTHLANFSANVVSSTPANLCSDSIFKYITPGCPDYYLSPFTAGTPNVPKTPQFGYYINFPSISGGFIPKGINPPIVVANSLFYTYFFPETADPCTGGSGSSYSWMTTDVKNPLKTDTRTGLTPLSGRMFIWSGVASDFMAVGTRGVLQGGAVAVANAPAGASKTTPEIHNFQGSTSQRFPKPRVWRTVH